MINRIFVNSNIHFGKPCIVGTRITVKSVLELINEGLSFKEIMLDFEDKTLNMLADSLKDYKFEEFSTLSLVKALVLKHPTLLMKLKPLLKVSKED